MSAADDRLEAEAIRWCLRTPTMDANDWFALTEWLEADPRHAEAYEHARQSELDGDLILAAEDGSPATISHPIEEPFFEPRRRPARLWQFGMAVAAALVAVVGGSALLHRPIDQGPQIVATAAGQTRSLRLADGSQVHLNGATRIALEGADRRVRLLDGEAYFEVVHRPDRPFELAIGATTLRDVGTAFDVTRRDDGFDVAVREGAVAVDPAGANRILGAGRTAHLSVRTGELRLAAVAPETVGSWRVGTLDFNDAPLGQVAADVGRSLGKTIVVDPALAQRRFSGTIKLTRDDPVMRARLAGLLGVETIVRADGWQLRSAARAAH